MGRIVYQGLESISVPADATVDVWSLFAGANNKIKLHGWEITSSAIATTITTCHLHRIIAIGSGGSASTTEELADEDDSAITASIRTLDTTPGADGGLIHGYQWEQLGQLGEIYTPEMRPKVKVSSGLALTWDSAVASTISGWICWEEL